MFSGIKKMYHQRQKDKEYDRLVQQDLNIRDEVYREEARKQAKREFAEDRAEALAYRREIFLEQERKKLEPKVAKLRDTRTKGEKFKAGMKKLGEGAKKLSKDSKGMGSGAFGGLQKMGSNSSFNVHNAIGGSCGSKKKGKSNSMSDRILRNI